MSLENPMRAPAVAMAALVAAAAITGSVPAMAANAQDFCAAEATPCQRYGAYVFQVRCALCHGSDGLGGGVVPLSVPGYPPTNLLQPKHAHDAEELRKLISGGSGVKGVSSFMPPWADELTLTQIESVVQFVVYLRKDTEGARLMLRAEAAAMKPSAGMGRALYQGRCALCHGPEGRANGRMAAIIKDPPPFNLTLSRAPDIYLREIISKGGAAMERSPRMPPWGGDLNPQEIESVILFLKTLREGP